MNEYQLLLGTKTLNDLMYFKTHVSRVNLSCFLSQLTQLTNEYQLLLGTKALNDLMYFKTHVSRVKCLLCSLSVDRVLSRSKTLNGLMYFKTHVSKVTVSLSCVLSQLT